MPEAVPKAEAKKAQLPVPSAGTTPVDWLNKEVLKEAEGTQSKSRGIRWNKRPSGAGEAKETPEELTRVPEAPPPSDDRSLPKQVEGAPEGPSRVPAVQPKPSPAAASHAEKAPEGPSRVPRMQKLNLPAASAGSASSEPPRAPVARVFARANPADWAPDGRLYKIYGRSLERTGQVTGQECRESQERAIRIIDSRRSARNQNYLDQEVVYDNAMEFTATLRTAAQFGAFKWPSSQLTYVNAVSICLSYAPPGCGIVIRNAFPIPETFLTHGRDIVDMCHGCGPHILPEIFAAGLHPVAMDTGVPPENSVQRQGLLDHAGLVKPLYSIYIARLHYALGYPIHGESAMQKWGDWGTFSPIARDGSRPFRVIFRVLVDTARQMPFKPKQNPNQRLYLADEVWITHAMLIAGPRTAELGNAVSEQLVPMPGGWDNLGQMVSLLAPTLRAPLQAAIEQQVAMGREHPQAAPVVRLLKRTSASQLDEAGRPVKKHRNTSERHANEMLLDTFVRVGTTLSIEQEGVNIAVEMIPGPHLTRDQTEDTQHWRHARLPLAPGADNRPVFTVEGGPSLLSISTEAETQLSDEVARLEKAKEERQEKIAQDAGEKQAEGEGRPKGLNKYNAQNKRRSQTHRDEARDGLLQGERVAPDIKERGKRLRSMNAMVPMLNVAYTRLIKARTPTLTVEDTTKFPHEQIQLPTQTPPPDYAAAWGGTGMDDDVTPPTVGSVLPLIALDDIRNITKSTMEGMAQKAQELDSLYSAREHAREEGTIPPAAASGAAGSSGVGAEPGVAHGTGSAPSTLGPPLPSGPPPENDQSLVRRLLVKCASIRSHASYDDSTDHWLSGEDHVNMYLKEVGQHHNSRPLPPHIRIVDNVWWRCAWGCVTWPAGDTPHVKATLMSVQLGLLEIDFDLDFHTGGMVPGDVYKPCWAASVALGLDAAYSVRQSTTNMMNLAYNWIDMVSTELGVLLGVSPCQEKATTAGCMLIPMPSLACYKDTEKTSGRGTKSWVMMHVIHFGTLTKSLTDGKRKKDIGSARQATITSAVSFGEFCSAMTTIAWSSF